MASEARGPQIRLGPALEARLQAARSQLSDKELSVAAFLQEDPQGFVSHSISALASRCGVSETVIIRLYRKLGYDGFHQFKIDIAQSMTAASPEGFSSLSASDSMEAVKRKVFAMTRQALEDSVDTVDSAQLERACAVLMQAKRVVIASFGGSASVALDLAHKLLKLGIIATPFNDPHMQVMSATVMAAGDVLIAISHSGNSRDIVETLEVAKGRGVATILLTGFPHSPAAKVAQINLVAVSRETEYQTDSMTSRIVQLAVVDTLYVAMIFAQKERALTTIRETSVAAAKKKL